jgi:preprotein translocase subunit SecG
MNTFLIWLLTIVHVVVAVFLIGLVLMQKSSEQGVGAAFGGGMTDTVFGGGTTTALVKLTIWCAGILLATTLVLAVLHTHRETSRSLMQRALESAPAAPAAPIGVPASPSPLTLPTTSSSPPAPLSPAPPAGGPGTAPAAPAAPAPPPSQPSK